MFSILLLAIPKEIKLRDEEEDGIDLGSHNLTSAHTLTQRFPLNVYCTGIGHRTRTDEILTRKATFKRALPYTPLFSPSKQTPSKECYTPVMLRYTTIFLTRIGS